MVKSVAIYLRLSAEEKNVKESESIFNQRLHLLEYISKDDELKNRSVLEFKDDGYSGTNDKRPGFQDLIAHVKQGKVDTILVKDLSRFSRDYILLGDYLENIFPFMQTRFISVNDRYDSREQGNGIEIDIQFKTLLYDFYTKDCSAKVKSVQNSQKRQGKYLGWNPPFGYQKDPNDRHKIISDNESAKVVKKIYELYLQGMSTVKIAATLNEWNIKTPSERKEELTNIKYSRQVAFSKSNRRLWNYGTVITILNNEFYIGTYVFNKTGNKVVGAKSTSIKRKDQWERIYNNHEAIITKEVFDKVQEMKKHKRGGASKSKRKANVRKSPLQSIVRCGECCRVFSIVNSTNNKQKYFKCIACSASEQKSVQLVVEEYEEAVYQCLIDKVGKDRIHLVSQTRESDTKSIDYKKEIKKIEGSIEKLDLKKRDSFDDYKSEEITREDFINIKEDIETQKLNLLSVKEKYEKLLYRSNEQNQSPNITEELDGKLTKQLVNEYIENIYIDKYGKIEVSYKE